MSWLMADTDLVERLRESRHSGHVAYTKFVSCYSKNEPNQIYCFFEGLEDKRYYGVRINLKTGKDFKDFTCGGKDEVKRVADLIKNQVEYREAITCFFIDKDYSVDTTSGNIYVTPCYALENFYTSKSTLKSILKNEFNMDEEEEDFNKIVDLYENLQVEFHNKLLFFNAWLACQSDIRIQEGTSTYLTIDENTKHYFDKFLNHTFQIKENIFDDLNNITKLENNLFPSAPKVETDKLVNKIKSFENADHAYIFRGKFEIKLLVAFLQKIKEVCGKKESKIFSKRYKCTLTFELANVISTLTQYARTPSCLNDFLDRNLKSA